MILADTLQYLIGQDRQGLSRILDKNGYSMMSFSKVKFLGMTNGGEFCYQVIYHDDDGLGEVTGKVFLRYDHATNFVSAQLD